MGTEYYSYTYLPISLNLINNKVLNSKWEIEHLKYG